MTQLPTLYKRTGTGALQEWAVFFDGDKYWTAFGQTKGAIQESAKVACDPKNVGRANETTAEQQAELGARALHRKKLKKDYTLDPGAVEGQKSAFIEGGVLPMLAHRYDQHESKIVFPCYAQPKLDGVRCIATVDAAGKCTLWSRTRKPIVSMPHIVKAIEDTGAKSITLDGELYNHEYHDRFEEIISLIRPEYAKPGHEVVQYHAYDIVAPRDFYMRNAELQAWQYEHFIYTGYDGPLRLVETEYVRTKEAALHYFGLYVEQGYEGTIMRNKLGPYENKRSYNLQKVKSMLDSEFEIVAVKEGKGKLEGHGIFTCVTKAFGTQFDCKMKGPTEKLKAYFEHPERYIGKKLTVQYQALTGTNKVPRFPVGLRIREDA